MCRLFLYCCFYLLMLLCPAFAGKLAIVIDDFGYRPVQENQLLKLPQTFAVAVLPDAPYAREMAEKAHLHGHEVLIHLPMAPLSKQPLEKNTIRTEMSRAEIEQIIHAAVQNVPWAAGLNNHMGSAMTSSLSGMQKVMQILDNYNFYFLDSMTIASSQSVPAAVGTRVKILKRRIFLDDNPKEAAIRQQLKRAVRLAKRDGQAIAIGHPHPATVRVLLQRLPEIAEEVTLVHPSQLQDRSPGTTLPEVSSGLLLCQHPHQHVPAVRALKITVQSIADSYVWQTFKSLF